VKEAEGEETEVSDSQNVVMMTTAESLGLFSNPPTAIVTILDLNRMRGSADLR
jgi:hypothetical protein